MGGGNAKWWVPIVVVAIAVSWWWNHGRATVAVPGSPPREVIDALLARVTVVDERPRPGGYDRGCEAGEGCVFGQAWSDDHPGPGGHDGCDTRNNVLARDLDEVVFRPDSGNCVVTDGVLDDPYTGRRVPFRRGRNSADVHIDHVYPLAAAWDHGAARWTAGMRRHFANDVAYNLVAVDGDANLDKRDHTPSDWLPPAVGYRCWYAGKYLSVAVRYGLPVTTDDHRALTEAAARCPR